MTTTSNKSKFMKKIEASSKSNHQSFAPQPSVEKPPEIWTFKEVECPDEVILFDSGAEWSTRDRSVHEMVASIFPALVTYIEAEPIMKTCLVRDEDEMEDEDEVQENPSPPAESLRPEYDASSASTTSSASSGEDFENEEFGPVEENAYRKRLEMVRSLLAQNPDASKRKLAKILTGKRMKPFHQSSRHQIKPPVRDSQVSLLFNDHHYIGRLSRLCLEGTGRLEFATGAVYEGTFSNNTLCGQGRLDWSDGSYYEGGFHHNRRHGYGLFRSADNNQEVYIGEWCQGVRHGKGCQFYNLSDNDFYEGDFHCNQRSGRGLRRWSDGQSYEGDWKKDVIHGHGVMRFLNGSYSGQWFRGQMHGIGTYVWTDSLDHSLSSTHAQHHSVSQLNHCLNQPLQSILVPNPSKNNRGGKTDHSLGNKFTRLYGNNNVEEKKNHLSDDLNSPIHDKNIAKETEIVSLEGMRSPTKTNNVGKETKNHSLACTHPTILCSNIQKGKTNHSLTGTLPTTHSKSSSMSSHSYNTAEETKDHPFAGTLPPSHGYNTYEGSWKFGQRHGAGVLHNATGMTFRGTWVKNKKHGPGVLRGANGINLTQIVCVNDVMYLNAERVGDNLCVANSIKSDSSQSRSNVTSAVADSDCQSKRKRSGKSSRSNDNSFKVKSDFTIKI